MQTRCTYRARKYSYTEALDATLIIFCYKSTTVLAQGLASCNFGFVHSVLQLSYEEYHRRSHCFTGPTEGEELGELQPPPP